MARVVTNQVELGRIKVEASIARRLKELSKRTGAPVQYHRRQAYAEYLAQQK